MEEKNDLMQDWTKDSGNNLKKYLIIAGSVFVLFVIGIVVSKFMLSNQKNDTEVILPPEIKVDKKQDTKLFNDIPIQKDNDIVQDNNDFKKPDITNDTIDTTNNNQPKTNQDIIDDVKNNTSTKKDNIQQPIQTQQTPKPKPVTQNQTTQNSVPIKKPHPQKPKTTTPKNYYIQVAALTRGNPSDKFLKLIKNNGFNYKIVEVTINNRHIKRVLIGGYTKAEAKNVLPKIKKTISSSAFIKKLK